MCLRTPTDRVDQKNYPQISQFLLFFHGVVSDHFLILAVISICVFRNSKYRQQISESPAIPLHKLPRHRPRVLAEEASPRKTLAALSNKHGRVFSLQLGSRRTLIVSSPSAAAECLSRSNDVVFANRPRLSAGKHLGNNFTSIVWAPYGGHWRNLRRISTVELLSSHRIHSLSPIRSDELRKLIRHLYEDSISASGGAKQIQMRSLIFELMFNSMTGMILGRRYYGEKEGDSVEAKEFHDIINQMNELAGKSTVEDFIPFLSRFRRSGDCFKAVQERMDKLLQNLIQGIRNQPSGAHQKPQTMIEVLFSLHQTDPHYYTDEINKSLTAVLLQAGSDTSVATMEWTMALLLNNPSVLNKAQMEIHNLVGNQRLIEDSDVSELPYIRCIISETLRLYPVAPLLLPHESSEDCTIGGFHIPRGTMLLINAWAIHHDPDVWEDPLMFKPERFMFGEDGIREESRHIPFGAGRRGCPGEALAMRMIGLALGSLVQCFDWQRIGDDLEDMTEDNGVVLSKAHPLLAKCCPRPTMLNVLSQL